MIENDLNIDAYEYYEELFNPEWADGTARGRKPSPKHVPKKAESQIIAELAEDLSDVNLGFETTYKPSKHEAGWLMSSLSTFYNEGLITDVLSLVKGGKEANVYCCQAHPATELGLVAAKVYRPRMFRNLRNDKMYRQGREILVSGGGVAGRDAGYIMRAIQHKTSFGLQAAHTSWLMHEHTAMERLFEAGGSVPQPIAAGENALLMSYHGDEGMAAPTLNTVALEKEEARWLFLEVLRNVDLMLQHDMVHGDLSAYNILYWPRDNGWGEITLIDFPQVTNLHTNRRARFILQRDIRLICAYFAEQGWPSNPRAIMEGFWRRYMPELDPLDRAADQSRLEAELEELAEQGFLEPIDA